MQVQPILFCCLRFFYAESTALRKKKRKEQEQKFLKGAFKQLSKDVVFLYLSPAAVAETHPLTGDYPRR